MVVNPATLIAMHSLKKLENWMPPPRLNPPPQFTTLTFGLVLRNV